MTTTATVPTTEKPWGPGRHLFECLKGVVAHRVRTVALLAGLCPVPAARPRVSKWGTYYPATYTKWQAAAKAALTVEGARIEGPVALYLEHVVTKARTSKRTYPHGDIDNFDKGPMDVLTKDTRVWDDDDQVVLTVAHKRYAEPGEEPGTTMVAIPLGEHE